MQLEEQPAAFANLELLCAFVEHAPAAVAMLDRDLRYLLVSRRWVTDYALENQDIVGREYYKVFPLLVNEQGRVKEGENTRVEDREFSNTILASGCLRVCGSSPLPHPMSLSPPDAVSQAIHPLDRWQEIFASCLAGEAHKGDSDYFLGADGSWKKVKWEIQPWRTHSGEIGGIMMFTEFQESHSLTQMPESEREKKTGVRSQNSGGVSNSPPELNSSKFLEGESNLIVNSEFSILNSSGENGYCRLRETATEGIWGTASLSNTIEQLQQEAAERRQAQALQQESEERYRSLIAAMAEGIILQDALGIIHTCNAAAERILGVSSDELMGRKFTDLRWYIVMEDGNPIHRKEHPLNETLRTGQSLTDVAIGIYKPDGTLIWLSLNSQPLFRPKETTPYAAVVSFIDITKRKQIGEALRESEERFRATFEQAAVGIIHAELDGSFVRVNQKFCDIVGYTREELLERSLHDITHPEEGIVDREYLRSLLAGKIETYSLEKRYLRKDGESIWVEITASLVQTPQSHRAVGQASVLPKYLLCVVQDISARKAAEAALRDSEAQLRNRAQREELLNRLSNQIRNSLDLNTILETAVQEIRELLQIDRCQFAWYQPDERRAYWEVVKEARNLEFPDRTGRYPAYLIGPLNETLLNLKIFQVDDVESLSDPILQSFMSALGCASVLSLPMRTPSGTIGAINCIHIQEARPWTSCEVELLNAVKAQLLIAIKQAELYSASRRATRDAQEKATQLEEALHELQRTQAQLIQSEKMSSLGQLVAGVAHEINNPVNFIYGNLIHAQGYFQDLLALMELYRSAYPYPPAIIQEHIEAIDLDFLITDLTQLQESMKVGAERIREIVRSLRTFSRLDESESKEVDIHTGIESTLMILQSRLRGKPGYPTISVIKEYENLPPVECYPGQLNQVFMNLLTNAIDALEERMKKPLPEATATRRETASDFSPTITITTGVLVKDNTGERENGTAGEREKSLTFSSGLDYNLHLFTPAPLRPLTMSPTHVFIRIADNGAGMTEKTKQQLFDPFFTTKPVGKGTGLGLAISYQIVVEKHGGQLQCNSVIGQGTEFVVEIPLRHCQEKG